MFLSDLALIGDDNFDGVFFLIFFSFFQFLYFHLFFLFFYFFWLAAMGHHTPPIRSKNEIHGNSFLCYGQNRLFNRILQVDSCTSELFKVGPSSFKKICFVCFNESPLKMVNNAFYFILKAQNLFLKAH